MSTWNALVGGVARDTAAERENRHCIRVARKQRGLLALPSAGELRLPAALAAIGARFTGKEEDVEVGLTYFGARYYAAALGRWISPDPLAVHAPGEADLNLYAYVHGRVLAAVDPDGLDDTSKDPPNAQVLQETHIVGHVDTPMSAPDGNKWNPYSPEGRAGAAVFGEAPRPPGVDLVSAAGHAFADATCGALGGCGAANAPSVSDVPVNSLTTPQIALNLTITYAVPKVLGGLGGKILATEARAAAVASRLPAVAERALPVLGEVAGKSCFAAGTLVHAEDGLRPIEDVQVGDLVWSEDVATGELALRRVVQTVVTPGQPILEIVFDDGQGHEEPVRVTFEHPFWTHRGWIGARYLRPVDDVMQRSGAWSRIVASRDVGMRVSVYNFEVEEFHTYFVGRQGVWVHNTGECFKNLEAARRLAAKVPGEFKCFGKCMDFAAHLRGAMMKAKVGGTLVRIERQGFGIGDFSGSGTFVGNSVHEAIRVGDVVFDNLNPGGVAYGAWRNALRFMHQPSVPIPDEFIAPTQF